MSTIIKARSPYHIQHQNLDSDPSLVNLTCGDIEFSGFAVDADGVITIPTAIITEGQTSIAIDSTFPSSFRRLDVTKPRTLECTLTVPSGYLNEGDEIICAAVATQQAQVVIMQCKTFQIENKSLTDTVTFEYRSCGNEIETIQVLSAATATICLHPQSTPVYIEGTENYNVKFLNFGCVTGSQAYALVGCVGSFSTRAEARAAYNSDFAANNRGNAIFIDVDGVTSLNVPDDFGLRQFSLVSFSATDSNSDGNPDKLTAPFLEDGWWALNISAASGFAQTNLEIEFRTVDSVIQEGGYSYGDGATLDPL